MVLEEGMLQCRGFKEGEKKHLLIVENNKLSSIH